MFVSPQAFPNLQFPNVLFYVKYIRVWVWEIWRRMKWNASTDRGSWESEDKWEMTVDLFTVLRWSSPSDGQHWGRPRGCVDLAGPRWGDPPDSTGLTGPGRPGEPRRPPDRHLHRHHRQHRARTGGERRSGPGGGPGRTARRRVSGDSGPGPPGSTSPCVGGERRSGCLCWLSSQTSSSWFLSDNTQNTLTPPNLSLTCVVGELLGELLAAGRKAGTVDVQVVPWVICWRTLLKSFSRVTWYINSFTEDQNSNIIGQSCLGKLHFRNIFS